MAAPLDPLAAVSAPDPYPYYAALVATRPFHRDERLGLWVATSAAAVRAVLTSDRCRVRPASEPVPRALLGSPAGDIFRQLVRMTAGPGQIQTKLAVAGALASTNPSLIVQHGAACAERLARELEPARDPSHLTEFAYRLSVYIIGTVLGFAADRLPELAAWTEAFVACLGPTATPEQVERGKTAAGRLVDAFQARFDQQGLDALLANRIGYLSQAYEATAGLIGNTLVALGRHPALRERARASRGALAAVIREVVRHDAPVQNTRRFVAESGTIASQALNTGDAVLVVLAAANRDPAANERPDEFDAARREREAFTFGAGRHACPGEVMATLIAEAGVARLLADGLELEPLVERVHYRPSMNTRVPIFASPT